DLEGDSDGEIVLDTKFEEDFPNQKGEEDLVWHGADVFNRFISKAGLEEVSLEGCSFTWCHRSATKMSKLDRFLISDSLLCSCPNISSITLDRYLSDHQSILMREVYYDYGPVPFRFFHYWFEVDGFDKFIEDSWKDAPIIESNDLVRMMKNISVGENNVVNRRTEVVNLLQEVEKKNSLKAAKRERLSTWIDSPSLVKSEFLSHFKNRFEQPNSNRLHMNMHFLNTLSSIQVADLECQVSKEEIKKAVWDCGIDKSPGLNGFTFGFYRRHWKLIENAVDFEKAYDSVRWDHLDDIMRKFGFGEKWCMWIQSCLRSSRGSVFMNGNTTEEFRFYKGLKQGDLLSPFFFILVMESLHISFQRVVDVDFFKGIELAPSLNLSHMFYAADAIFMGQWSESNIDTIVKVLDCFNRTSGLRINMTKSKLLGISVEEDKAKQAAAKIGCNTLKTPFSYLGSKVGGFPKKVLHRMESMRSHFFNGAELSSKSRFRVIKALHGYDGKIGQKVKSCYPSLWLDIIHEVEMFKSHGSCEFTITSVRKMIDDFMLPEVSSKTRWIKAVPIKVNVHTWKVKLDGLPTRLNISCRGIDIESILCPMCGKAVESTSHIFFTYQMCKEILRKISRLWDIDYMEISSC
nr:RNA-directed DNA polymerase, eukaryota, reverse transcriptase zinc-binding domain protein [Tanacetum cinerariifolium]